MQGEESTGLESALTSTGDADMEELKNWKFSKISYLFPIIYIYYLYEKKTFLSKNIFF